jgi:hypothetical protein
MRNPSVHRVCSHLCRIVRLFGLFSALDMTHVRRLRAERSTPKGQASGWGQTDRRQRTACMRVSKGRGGSLLGVELGEPLRQRALPPDHLLNLSDNQRVLKVGQPSVLGGLLQDGYHTQHGSHRATKSECTPHVTIKTQQQMVSPTLLKIRVEMKRGPRTATATYCIIMPISSEGGEGEGAGSTPAASLQSACGRGCW